jgi:hypothetical protein
MSTYLTALEKLLRRKIEKSELLSADETNQIREFTIKVWKKYPQVKFEIPFEDKSKPAFKVFLESLAKSSPEQVYIWMAHTNECGLCKPVKLLDINFDFEYEWLPEGDLIVVTRDGENRMALDFSEDDGKRILEIRIQGRDWSRITY